MSKRLRVTLTYAVIMAWPFLVAYLYSDFLTPKWISSAFREFIGFFAVLVFPGLAILLYNVWDNVPKDKE